tara:strand:- start:2633 stop:3550 length:918 start_codon:yes stop_codon:yes gene_type:complete
MCAVQKSTISEEKALTLSLAMTTFISFLGITAGLYLQSNAILLDGFFSLFSVLMTGLILFICHLVSKEDDEYFQFGYSHLEPLVSVINSALLILICAYAAWSAWDVLTTGGRLIELDFAMIYASITLVIATLMYKFEVYANQFHHSELLRVDANEWYVDAILSLALLIGFSVARGTALIGYQDVSLIIDPLLTFGMATFACWLPLKVLKRNMREVLRLAPKDNMAYRVDRAIAALQKQKGIITCQSHLAKFGRRYELEINILVSKKYDWNVREQDALREQLIQDLHSTIDELWLSVCFTQQERWL